VYVHAGPVRTVVALDMYVCTSGGCKATIDSGPAASKQVSEKAAALRVWSMGSAGVLSFARARSHEGAHEGTRCLYEEILARARDRHDLHVRDRLGMLNCSGPAEAELSPKNVVYWKFYSTCALRSGPVLVRDV
jgi:hypothetical protein